MPHSPKRLRLTFEPDFQAQSEIQGLEVADVLVAEDEETSSISSCSFNFSYPSTSASPPSSPVIPVSLEEEEEEEPAATLSPPQSPQSSCSFSASWSTSEGVSSSQEKDTSSPYTSTDTESLPRDPLDEKVADLVHFMVLKYRLKEPITKAEMLKFVIKRYKKQFPVIFQKASKCLEVISGIDVKEVDPTTHSYVLVNSLDLTCDEMLSDNQSMPKNGLLIIILGVIFIEGNCAPEEDIWDFLNVMGVYAGRDHFIYGEPRNLITRDWVQENYLEYRQVPNSDPPCYEFLWGPRAHAETSKMKVLEFLAKIKGTDPISFSYWYEEALRDEEERAQRRIGSVDNTTSMFIAQHWSAASPAPTEE
ncbi:melanoma-associated antigen 10-like [Mirounga angustirostris]|uniref:melanoma-associated antigen 10-like n=1 Tax=Mirounga leonina TaxID=9715 RepID=UPI00156C1ECF|nr:melanoma-associated antigen 10-like [Mirounga leonina]XP_045736641.1 melanoma-associated antigen 10-like [Mirounga angustirostris]